MANGNGGGNGFLKFLLVFIMIACFLGAAFFLYTWFKDKNKSSAERIEEQQNEIERLKLEASKLQDTILQSRYTTWGIWAICAFAVVLIAYFYIKAKYNKDKKYLTIAEGEEKCRAWCKEKLREEPIWMQTDSYERRDGAAKLYVTSCGFTKRIPNFPIYWSSVKILPYMNDDWECARIENIEQGLSMFEALTVIIPEFENKGFTIIRSKAIIEAQALKNLADQRKAEDEVFESMGIKPGTDGA